MSSYTASKFGVRGMFHSIRPMFADCGMQVNLIAPWIMDTPLAVDWLKMFDAVGAPLGNTQDVINAAMRFADDPKVNGQCAPYLPLVYKLVLRTYVGRAFACGPKLILDLGDDIEGEDAGKAMHGYYETGLPEWDGSWTDRTNGDLKRLWNAREDTQEKFPIIQISTIEPIKS